MKPDTDSYYRIKQAVERFLLHEKAPICITRLVRQFHHIFRCFVRIAAHELAKNNESGIYRVGVGWYAHTGMDFNKVKQFHGSGKDIKFIAKEWVLWFSATEWITRLQRNR